MRVSAVTQYLNHAGALAGGYVGWKFVTANSNDLTPFVRMSAQAFGAVGGGVGGWYAVKLVGCACGAVGFLMAMALGG